MEEEKWSQWFAHDGVSVPFKKGFIYRLRLNNGFEFVSGRPFTNEENESYIEKYQKYVKSGGPLCGNMGVFWNTMGNLVPLIEYKYKIPKGMEILNKILNEVKPELPKVVGVPESV